MVKYRIGSKLPSALSVSLLENCCSLRNPLHPASPPFAPMPYFSHAMPEPTFESENPDSSINLALHRALAALEDSDFHTRWEAAKQITACGVAAIEPLLHLLEDDPDEDLTWYIARILGTFDHPLALHGLIQLLHSESEDVAGMAATALTNFGVAAIPPLTDLLHQPQTRLLAIRALAQIHHPDAVPLLLPLTADSLAPVRSTAIDALSRFNHSASYSPAITEVLLTALKDLDSSVRRSAVSALGVQAQGFQAQGLNFSDFNSDDLIQALQPLLWDIDLEVCCQTALTLGRIGIPESIAPLNQVLQSPTTPIPLQQAIIRAIGWIGTVDALDCLQQGLLSDRLPEESQLEIVMVLGRLKTSEVREFAANFLLNVLNSQHSLSQISKGKQTIVHSLGQLLENTEGETLGNIKSDLEQANRMIDTLISLLGDRDTGVQLHVIAVLKDFDPAWVNFKLTARMRDETISADLREGIKTALAERERSIE